MVSHISAHPLFASLTDTELKKDPIVDLLFNSTEEGQKVTRNLKIMFPAVFKRLENPKII